ncbi:MAG TPA: MFS transporter [Stellaceae bacterium]|jgi:PPP family 3-phenylpropionic acid transporter|nr:MFS transporter [Stellaceae bacterium]
MASSLPAARIPAWNLPTTRRMALFYAASFLVVGIQTPFWPVWLAGRGFDAQEIALIFAAAIWGKVVATPALGALADRLGRRRAVMLVLAALSLAAYAGLWPVAGFWAVLALNLVAGTAQSALMPLGDTVTLAAVRNEGADYGRIRLWGSVTFIVAAAGSGALLATAAPADPAGNAILVLVLSASAVLLLACFAVPPALAGGAGAARWAALARLATDRRFWLFTASAAALQSSHQLYYGFGSLYWRTLGFSDAVIGALWAEGVVAEIVLFWRGGRLAARLGPLGLMALGGGAGILRWSLIGVVPGLGAAALLQLLHAFTFGASHLGAMYFMARTVPPAAAASAQSLYAGLSTGIGSGLVMLASGRLYASFGGGAYLFMAVLSAAGIAGVAVLAATSRISVPAE